MGNFHFSTVGLWLRKSDLAKGEKYLRQLSPIPCGTMDLRTLGESWFFT
jgi:hypothetical protein